MLFAAGCGGEGEGPSSQAATGSAEEQRARALLAPEALLPPRAETVALADAVAIASSRAGTTGRGAELARLAADLRVRLFRLDQAATDGREALELYAAAATAFRAVGSAEGACEADRRRAALAGELARDAAVSYRELYLVSRRHAAVAVAGAGQGAAPGDRSACLGAIDLALAQAAAYRPTGEKLRGLEQEGHRAEQAALAGTAAPSAAAASSGAAPASVSSASAAAERERERERESPVQISTSDPSAADLVLAPRAVDKPAGPLKVTSIERFGSDKGARVVIQLSAPSTFKVGALPADEATGKDARVFLDIAGASARGIPREIEVGGALRRVRIGAQADGTRVVLDLAASLYRRIFYLPDPFRIVIDVSTRPPLREDKAEGQGGKREVRRVAVDPGHGGTDAGAVGPTGLKEAEITLDIAHRVAPLLARELKIETLLTRDNDAFVPLELRTARANAFHADLFVSIHCNASEDGLARGVQTFSLDASREADRLAARVAARENAAALGKPAPAGASDAAEAEVAAILSGLNVGDMATRSRHFADLLQRSALSSLGPRYPGTKDQGVKSAGFFVLVGADMPAALFETAFISNPEDEARLATADFRQKMADAIVNAIRAWREGK